MKYDYTGVVSKFGQKWRWVKQRRYHPDDDRPIEIFRVEPYYEFDHTKPCPRPADGNLTLTIEVRGTTYIFPARRMPCRTCDGGIRRKLKLRPHGGVCYCDSGTILDFDREKMTAEQLETIAVYHLDLQMSSSW